MNPLATRTGPQEIPATAHASEPERRLRVLYELSDRASRAGGVNDVVAATLDAIQRTGLAQRASVLLFDDDGVMRFKDSRGLSEEYRRAVEGHTPWRPDTPDPKPVLVADVERDPSLAPYHPVFARESIRSLGFFPLVHDARVLGKFMLYHATAHDFSEDEVLLAQTIAGHVSNALGRREAERALDHARAQLAHNEKLSALGSLVGGVAHELRTPLTYLANNLAIIERNVERALREADSARAQPLRETVQRSLADAHESIERIDRIVLDLRKYTRLKARDERKPLALDAVVGEAVELFRAARRGRVHVLDELAPTALASVDRVQVQQIVINLLENAYEANPRDAAVRISTRTQPDRWIAIVVEDRGEGMSPEVQARIWDPFYTTKPHGSGLGLAIVKRIADEHGARIEVDSRPGVGTRLTVLFPPA